MSSPLKVTHYGNGDSIPLPTFYDFGSLDEGQYGVPNDAEFDVDDYGYFYNWAATIDDRGLCPQGFHVPSDGEFIELEVFLGMSIEEANTFTFSNPRGLNQGSKISGREDLWWEGDLVSDEAFAIIPIGIVPSAWMSPNNGANHTYETRGWVSHIWTTTDGIFRAITFNSTGIYRFNGEQLYGKSVYCLADEIITGCTGESSCNYNPDANVDDGSCIYPDNHYDCYGNCLVELDCAGNCCVIGDDGCYWQENGPCGEPSPSDGMDSCGVCGGDNSSCSDCAGVPCSNAYVDNCGVCDDDSTNDCVLGCDGVWGGAELDECGICDGDGSSCADTDGDGCADDIDDAPMEWDDDYDADGVPDDCDVDDDNDGAEDSADSNDNNEYVCSDVDGDTCDDCSFGMFDPANDGPDMNYNGICDPGDINDTDGDGVLDDDDSDPFNPYQCADNDGDACDDCGSGYYDPANDGADYDGDGICNVGDMDDDNDGVIDSEDCAPQYELASDIDCCGVCGGDNSSCGTCCGLPFDEDCSSGCEIDEMGVCCMVEELDECGMCGGDNSCLCEDPFISVSGQCLHKDDIGALQDMIDNSMSSGYDFDCYDVNDPWCQSPNIYMDDQDNWHSIAIDGMYLQASNGNGIVEPLELGLQEWTNGRLTSLMCGAYIYCNLSGEIPNSISDLTEIEVLRLEVNYFSGYVPDSICELDNLNYNDYLAFDLSYNQLCPPYPDCIPDSAVNYMQTEDCAEIGDINLDGSINVLDVVMLVSSILEGASLPEGDINGDSATNVLDVVMLVSMILEGI